MNTPMEQQHTPSTSTNHPHQDVLDKAMDYYYADDFENARVLSEQLLGLTPQDHGVLLFAGAVARAQKRFAESAEFLKQSIVSASDPQRAAASWCGLGKTLREAGDLRQAEEAFRRAVRSDSSVCGFATELAQTYIDGWKLDLAIETLKTAIIQHATDPLPCANLAGVLTKFGRQNDALIAYDLAITRNPNNPRVHRDRGVVLKMLGRFAEAEDEFIEALRLDPVIDIYTHLTQLKNFDLDTPEIQPILKQWDPKNDAPLESRIDAGFALAKLYDKAKNYRTAFQYLEAANRLKRAEIEFSVAEHEAMSQGVMSLYTRDFITRYSGKSGAELAPIFVLGMPRSGTTLTEQILASHSEVRGGGELINIMRAGKELGKIWESRGKHAPGSDEMVAQDLKIVASHYADMTSHLWRRHPHFTDKMPMNYLYIGVIHLLFPKAKIIYCRRNPIANCLSCYQILFGANNLLFSYDLTELGQVYKIHERIMAHWQKVLPGQILEMEYEDLVQHPEANIKRMLKYCELEFEPACLDFHKLDRPIATASLMQVRKPIYKESIDHWKNYQTFLGSLFNALRLDPTSIKSS